MKGESGEEDQSRSLGMTEGRWFGNVRVLARTQTGRLDS